VNWNLPKVYAVRHKDEEIRANSRSGGIFTAISDYILNEKGIVYGCVLNDKFEAIHTRADNMDIRDRMRGSKYIQSKIGNTYVEVKKDLLKGKKVLFSGTSCQIDGLRKYLGDEFDNLFCIDIVCHGVPSPKVWNEYLKWQEKKRKTKIITVDYRNKREFGWRAHIETLFLENGYQINSQIFTKLFYGHCILRPSCYYCPYKSVIHPGDITIADYWGIEKAAPEFDDNKGVSLVLINNEKGESVFEKVKCELRWKETKLEDSMQRPLYEAFPEPNIRTQFWNDFREKNFEYIAKKYGGRGSLNKIKRIIKRVLRKLIKENE